MMNVEADVQELERLVGAPSAEPMLTVYLLTDPSLASGRNLHAQISSLGQTLRHQVSGNDERGMLDRALSAVENSVDSMGNPPRSLAAFVGSQPGFLKIVRLPTRVGPLAHWGAGPYLRPLRAALDEHEPVLIALVDKERARILRLALDEIEQVEEFEDLVPGKHRQAGGAWAPKPGMWAPGGWGDRGIERDHELHVQQHVRLALDSLRSHVERGPARVILAGPPEVRALLQALAPRPVQARIIGELRIPLFASAEEVRRAVEEITSAAERRAEEQLIQEMAEKEGRGFAIFGPSVVAHAIVEGQAALLVFADTAEIEGAVCATCGNVTTGRGTDGQGRCSRCGGPTEADLDVIDLLSHRLIAQGGRVEEVREGAAERLLARGGIAAILRYPVTSSATTETTFGTRGG